MMVHQRLPHDQFSNWISRSVRQDSGTGDYHYHQVEEWLEVLEGEICFVSAGGVEYPLSRGGVLSIAQGEVHRVQVGPNGVAYKMWLPILVPDAKFSEQLSSGELALINNNLQIPQQEDNKDDKARREYFGQLLADELMFRSAAGQVFIGKVAFLNRKQTAIERQASDCVQVLQRKKNADRESMLVSTVVHTWPKGVGSSENREAKKQSTTNFRQFYKEENRWKLNLWINFPV